jgi:Mg-chelatase subunit ChlD
MESLGFATAWPLLLLAVLPVVWSLAVHSRAAIGRGRTLAAAVLRCLALILIALALMRPALRIAEERISVVYAVDISRSVSPAFVDSALDWIADSERRHRPAQSRVLAFADRARLVETPDALRALTVSADGDGADDAIDQSATDLEQALTASVFGFAQGHAKRLVLFTDGNTTGGDVWRALPRLQAEGIRVYALPAAPAALNDAWIDDIRVPEDVRQQQPLAVEVRIFAQRPAAARVELASGERQLGTRTLRLSAGENIVSIPARLPARGPNDLIARVTADGDEVSRNDSLIRSVWVGPRPRVLYVEHNADSAHYLSEALRAQGMSVTLVSPEALPDAVRRLDAIDAVILSDVPAERVDAASAARLEAFVRDRGGGLVFAAGENTYGKEGFASTAVERLLPVRFEAKRKRKDLDLVLLIDRSHSMRGRKLELAKSAALASLDLLEEQHRLAVIAFDARPHDVVPLAAVGSKRRAEDLIAGMTASGQTNIYNALLRAQRLLADSTAGTRHVILLSDGITAPPPGTATVLSSSEAAQEQVRKDRAETIRQAGGVVDPPAPEAGPALEAASAVGGFPGIVAELAAAQVTLSTVAIGKRADLELMASLAQGAGGRHYAAQADAEIPGLFVAETRRLLGESVIETPFRPIVKARAGAIAGLDFAAGPALQGFVIGRPKRFSDVLLEAPKDKPLLAQTRYGLGKTVVFLSDVKNRWAVDWLTWPGYGKLWAQVVRDAMRRDSSEGLAFRVTRDGREAAITLSALDAQGNYRNSLAPRVRVVMPGGETSVVALRQTAPGQYHARMPLARAGAVPWRFELLPGPGIAPAELARAGTRSLFYAYSDEYRSLPADVALLRALSEQTGGAFAPEAAEIFRPRGDSGVTERPLWPWLAALALLLYLLDLLVRRAP